MAVLSSRFSKSKLKSWLSDNDNRILIALLLVALVIRLYYFLVTMHQPLWWDEAEYMLKAKNIALGTPDTGWAGAIRPILFPFVASFFFFTGLGETPLRLAFAILSVVGIGLVYGIGKTMFSKRIGLLAAFLMTFFYIDLFYSTRLLVDVPQIVFVTLALFLFVKYKFGNGSKKVVWWILPIIFIGTQVRFTVGLVAGIFLIFLLATEGLGLFKKKEWYASLGFALLCFVPYFIYSWIKFGNPLYSILQGLTSANAERGEGVTAFDIFKQYIVYSPDYLHWIFFAFFIVGAIMVLSYLLLGLDKLRSNSTAQKYLLLTLFIVLPLIYFGFFVNHFEDRYLFMAFPAVFIVAALGIRTLYRYGASYKSLALLVLAVLLIYGAAISLQGADTLIKSRVTSYEGLRQAGLWVQNHSVPTDAIASAGMPEITYYSERPTYAYPVNESEFSNVIEEKKVRFVIVSVWERSPEWTYDWPQRNAQRIKATQVFTLPGTDNQPSAIVYQLV